MPTNLAITALTESFGLVASRLQHEIDELTIERDTLKAIYEHCRQTLGTKNDETLQTSIQHVLQQLSDANTEAIRLKNQWLSAQPATYDTDDDIPF